MRNLKRVLALALALVMMLGMMITASAASYTDEAAINEDYAVAVEVLSDMGVFKGTGAGFAPKAILSRAEAATLIYRVITADVDDKKVDLYDYSSFADVAEGVWYTPYVTYAANGGYIKGYDGNFMPNDSVTGIQVLAIMLRAMGYGQKGEFEGAAWKDNVLTTADDLKILNNVAANDLDKPASRELVAQLLWDAINADTTTYMPAFGYLPSVVSLGEKKFELAEDTDVDEWGRPLYGWTYTTGEEETWFVEDHVTYYTAVTECDVASATKQKTNVKPYTIYTNGVLNSEAGSITATATVATIGAQGQLTEVYPKSGVIVHIDTLLAQVTDVKAATFDAAGHLKTNSSITLNIYDANTANADAGYATVTLTNGKINYEYAKNDVVLVSAVQTVAGDVIEIGDYKHVEIQGLATAMTGAQSTIWFYADQHTVNGTIYNDNNRFHLDEAGHEVVNHTWYFDANGNLIGVVDIDTIYAYGVLSSLYWVNDGSNYGAGAAYGVITYMDGTNSGIVEIDAVDGLPTVYARDTVVGPVDTSANPDGVADVYYVSTYGLDNAAMLLTELYEIETQADGTLVLTKQSKTTGEDSDIITGVSKVGDELLYADNNTQYLVYNPVTKTFSAVTGYDNIADFTNIDFCYKNNRTNTFMQYVFIKGLADEASASDFVFITNRGVNYTLGKFGGVDVITVSGVVRADGSTTPIVVKANAEGTTAATVTALQAKFDGAIGKLFKVPTLGGNVTDVDAIVEVPNTGIQQSATSKLWAEYEGKPTNYTNNGVLVVDGKHYNVNATTTLIVTEAGIGTTADLTAAVVNGKQVYVVYNELAPTTAIAIFVTNYVGLNGNDVALAAAKATAKTELNYIAANIVAYWNGVNGTSVTVADKAVKDVIDAQLKAIDDATSIEAVEKIISRPFDVTKTGYVAVDAAAKAATEAAKKAAADAAKKILDIDATTVSFVADATTNSAMIKALADGAYKFDKIPTLDPTIQHTNDASDIIFIKFTTMIDTTKATLKISDATKTYLTDEQTVTWTAETGHFFYVQVTDNGHTDGLYNEGTGDLTSGAGLSEGTYTYSIVDQAGNVLALGTFVIA